MDHNPMEHEPAARRLDPPFAPPFPIAAKLRQELPCICEDGLGGLDYVEARWHPATSAYTVTRHGLNSYVRYTGSYPLMLAYYYEAILEMVWETRIGIAACD